MNEDIKVCVDKYPDEIRELYIKLRAIIYDSVSQEIEEQLDGYKITPKGML